ncbi:protein spire homolog 1-like [Carassius auratus]|uniref:Protein spire homolog 1-like n=1 Tax=Carassius auratus TaxID=7957 RepID=A0A6P6LJA7_CARAU|nr:protein spire homolog 1-like [Carassius auratus]
MARRRDEDDDDARHKLLEEEDADDNEDARSIMDSEDEDHLSLDEILHLYKQPINEEQAWAVCYQCCRSLLEDSAASGGEEHVRIYKDGSVRFHSGVRSGDKSTPLLHSYTDDKLMDLGADVLKRLI